MTKKELDYFIGKGTKDFNTDGLITITPSGREIIVSFYQPPTENLIEIEEGTKYKVTIEKIKDD